MPIDLGIKTTHEIDAVRSIVISYGDPIHGTILAGHYAVVDADTGAFLRASTRPPIVRTLEDLSKDAEWAGVLAKLPDIVDRFAVDDEVKRAAVLVEALTVDVDAKP
jgi:hypothetical protein